MKAVPPVAVRLIALGRERNTDLSTELKKGDLTAVQLLRARKRWEHVHESETLHVLPFSVEPS
jgi:hypothetical protein